LLAPALVLRCRPRASLLLAPAVVLAMASAARAGRLLTPVGPAPHALPRGVARGRALALGRTALADLRARTTAVVSGFPLGDDATAELELRRFEPFAPGARVEAVDGRGVRAVKLPDHVYFTGTVRGEPTSRVVMIAARDHVRGFVAARGTVYPFGPDRRGRHRSYALRDVDPGAYPRPRAFCANDLHRDQVELPGARLAAAVAPPPLASTSSGLVQADAAIETDHELWAKFGSDSGTLDYLASLAAASSSIDERDVSVRLRFSYIRLWATAADPWSGTAPDQQLAEVRSYWTNPANGMDAIAGPHDLVHFISGKAVEGGIAYIGSVCDPRYFFGVSQVFGHFDLSDPTQIWDVLVVTHEIGHNLGTPHTHCYSPPVDRCYAQEANCYAGPVVCSRGTIMSYCHLACGGLPDIDLVFGDVVSAEIRSTVATATCLTPLTGNCGNGVVDPGEQCDDGNTVSGDGCSQTCRVEVCGNGIPDPGEQCDDGNTVSGDGCSATCQREPRCGDGVVEAGEQCDDGNTVSGDGCSASCRLEMCRILYAGQTLWVRSLVSVQHGAPGRDRLSLRAAFTIPSAFGTLDPAATGTSLLVDDAAGGNQLALTIPPGAHWARRGRRWLYRDRVGSVGGIRKLVIADDSGGGVPGVDVSVTGRNGSYPLAFAELPLAVTIVLGDATAGQAGYCGRRSFDAGSCTAARGGSRLVCH
jgi:cysteine-rich repeat protein